MLKSRARARVDEDGASAVEYGLLVVAIAAALALVVFFLGGMVLSLFTTTCTNVHSKVSSSTSC